MRRDSDLIDNVRWFVRYEPAQDAEWSPRTIALFLIGAAAFAWGIVIAAVAVLGGL